MEEIRGMKQSKMLHTNADEYDEEGNGFKPNLRGNRGSPNHTNCGLTRDNMLYMPGTKITRALVGKPGTKHMDFPRGIVQRGKESMARLYTKGHFAHQRTPLDCGKGVI